jgi:hypothetical protein
VGYNNGVIIWPLYFNCKEESSEKYSTQADRDYRLMMVHRILLVVVKPFEFRYPFPVISMKTSNEVE